MLRKFLFLFGCIGTRSLITYLSSNINFLPYIGVFYLLCSIGILYIYIFGSEKADAQLEWLGEKKIWWNNLRPIHGFIWLVFSILAFVKFKYSWVVLGIDTIFGLFMWLLHTYFQSPNKY